MDSDSEETKIVQVEYETIVSESESGVSFRIDGAIFTIDRSRILSYDYEGRLYVDAGDAELLVSISSGDG